MSSVVPPPPEPPAAPRSVPTSDLPALAIMHVADLVPHEQPDPRRITRLSARIERDQILKNPIIAAPLGESGYAVVLDGANRTGALASLGIRDALVQLVDYHDPGLQLLTWHHLVSGLTPQHLLAQVLNIPGLTVVPATVEAARDGLATGRILAYLLVPLLSADGSGMQVYTLAGSGGGSQDHNDTDLLLQLVDIYKGKPDTAIHRVTSDALVDLLPYYDNVSGLIVFPAYTPADILHLAGQRLYVPTGITRHLIPARALRVNVPLSLLQADTSLAEKNIWWHERIKAKLAANEIRFYQESTYLFDE